MKTKRSIIAILLGFFILAGCGKRPDAERSAVYARGYELPDLETAANAPAFDPGGVSYAEAVWTGPAGSEVPRRVEEPLATA